MESSGDLETLRRGTEALERALDRAAMVPTASPVGAAAGGGAGRGVADDDTVDAEYREV
jgi:hypothetical protein